MLSNNAHQQVNIILYLDLSQNRTSICTCAFIGIGERIENLQKKESAPSKIVKRFG
jgi:hypothetical protein